jgi:hypothetical protein
MPDDLIPLTLTGREYDTIYAAVSIASFSANARWDRMAHRAPGTHSEHRIEQARLHAERLTEVLRTLRKAVDLPDRNPAA